MHLIAPAGCQSPRDLTHTGVASLWREAGVEMIATRLFKSIEEVYGKLAQHIKYDVNLEHSIEELGGYGGLIINGQVGSEGGTPLVDKTVRGIKRTWE